jgi:dihydrofolate reductase
MSPDKVVVHRAMSLDGFVAGPDHEMDWIFEHAAPGEGAEDIMAATGAILSGRHTYDVGQRSRRPETSAAYGGAWSGAEFVLTHQAKTEDDDPSVVFLSGDVAAAVAVGLEAAGGKNLEVLGNDVTVQCFAQGLVDEIYVHVLPVLLGAGVPLYATEGMVPVNLEPIGAVSSNAMTSLRYGVRR